MASNHYPVLLRLISSSVVIARGAGKIIRDVMSKGELGIIEKGVNDPQTEADRRAQRCIVGNLSRKFPSLKIIGEEDAYLPGSSNLDKDEVVIDEIDEEILHLPCPEELVQIKEEELVVWVDPLDGTSEYTNGHLDHVTVLIGIARNGHPVGGVIHQPYYNFQNDNIGYGRTLWGIPGIGTGGFKALPPPEGQKIVATTRSHMTELVQLSLDALKPDQVLKIGGAGYKVMLLMEGLATAYVFASAGCNKWDTCAPEAILTALGGRLTDIHGKSYHYGTNTEHPNKRGVLATARAEDHSWFVETIPDAVKEKLV